MNFVFGGIWLPNRGAELRNAILQTNSTKFKKINICGIQATTDVA